MSEHVPAWRLRQAFADQLSAIYRAEVPAYGTLLELVGRINADPQIRPPGHAERTRLGDERHGAIRLAHPRELSLIRRALALLGMHPVGYYDLSPVGLPVHSTAFRPIESADLNRNAFRLFTSLVRLDQLRSPGLRQEADRLVAKRSILSPDALKLMEIGERNGGFRLDESRLFLAELVDTFRWRGEALSSHSFYEETVNAHPLVADVVCFPNPHINHLTPRVTDIDQAQLDMLAYGLPAKERIEGPPRRKCPILLRQTAFRALDENVSFPSDAAAVDAIDGVHTARFGEIESRGAAMTPGGMELYQSCLASGSFEAIADDWGSLYDHHLVWFRFEHCTSGNAAEGLPINERIRAIPITYEDFLPVSAAGIFRSNLKESGAMDCGEASSQPEFEAALGLSVLDPQSLYAAEARSSYALASEQAARA